MPSTERSDSRDSDRNLRHQHSSSFDYGRAVVPMWDSSDPERAPPPLPMNPSSPITASRPNTSSAIQAAHSALTEKARENAYVSNALAKRPEPAPERSLIKGATHKRMQSLQTGNVRDLSSFLESNNLSKSPEKSPTRRPSTPHANKDFVLERSGSLEKENRSSTPTPGRDTPTLRPSLRKPERHQSILGENTPPQSATMMALQNMVSRDTDMPMPLSNVTNGSTALVRAPPTFDAISNQILSLTSIATSLQREMANLTRRSKDNATDLVSLKEATNARDEDIRKSLRELVVNLEEAGSRSASNYLTGASGGLFLDNKAHNSPRSGTIKPFTLPRIPSPNSFASSLDRESTSTPDSATSIALLERILREMGTREGQDLLVSRLTLVADQLTRDGMSTAKKLEDLVRFIKDNTESQALIAHNGDSRSRGFSFDEPPRLELDFDRPRSGPMTQRVEALLSPSNKENRRDSAPVRPSEVLNDDIIKIIRSTKDSVAQGGGLTAEVKALVRELRGEVLGMGREIGRKLEQASTKDASKDAGQSKEDVTHIVEDGLKDLKQHMDGILREHRRQSSESISRNVVDYQEIYNAVRAALNEKPQSPEASSLGKEDIIEAVREAWENYKPDIELQHFGLEREELLAALKEGIQQYTPRESARDVGGATREEVFAAVVEGLKHFSPPRIESEAGLSRDEILDAVRECLEEFEFPAAPSALPREDDVTRDLMLDAVNEGLHKFNFPDKAPVSKDVILEAVSEGLQHFQPSTEAGVSREVVLDAVHEALQSFELPASSPISRDVMLDAINEGLNNFDFSAVNSMTISRDIGGSLTRDDLFDAVKAGLEAAPTAMYAYGEQQVYERLQEIIETMRTEFQAVSQEAKQNVAAHGRDTEQLLDATKDGFDRLRNDIETYVDRAADVTGKDEILDCVRESFDALRVEVSALVSKGSESSLDSVQGELEHLRETMATSLVRGGSGIDKDEIIEVLRQGLDGLRADIERPRTSNESFMSGTGEILDTLREGFDALRADIDRPRNNENATLGTGEILDALRDGFDALRADIERPRENNQIVLAGPEKSGGNLDKSGEILETLREVSNEIRSAEILDTLREGFDALHAEVNRPRGGNESIMSGTGEILDTLREGFDALRADIERPRNNNESSTGGTVEILNALQDGLAGLRAEVEKLGSKPVDMTVNYEILDTLKAGLEGVRADIDRLRESGTAKSESNERAVAAITNSAVVPAADGLKRNDIENLEVLITQLRIKIEALESMPPPPPQEVPGAVSKDDLVVGLAALEDLLRNVQESVNGIANQEKTVDEDAPKREDLEAIETLLRNTKAKIDEIDPEQAVTKDHLDLVEAVLRETRDDINQLASNLQDVSKKDDMGTLESLVREVVVGLEEMKERAVNESEDLEKVTKTDVEAVEAVCHDVKSAIEQMVLSDIAALAAKEDVINLQELLKETTGRIETHAETNAKAFEERQAETVGVGERVTEIKTFLEEFKNAIKEKMDEGSTSVEALSKLLEGLGETLSKNTSTTTDDIKGVLENMKTEFEKSNAGVVGAKLETDEKFQETWDKFDGKLDEKFNELLSKYDDAQASTEELMKIGEAKNAETMEALLGTKTVAEDLKSLIDTLGATLTDSVDKMDEAGKTVFSRVEDTFTRVEETHADAKAEHQLTREQVFKAIEGIEGVQGNVTDYHPKILESIKDVLLIVGQHYEHSKTSSSEISQKITDIPPPPPPIELPLLKEPEPVEKYDDTPVHEKLDKLVDHMHAAGKSFAQLDMLDKIHQQVIQTAAEVSEFVTAQTQRIADDHEDKEKAVEAATIALEKRLAQKEQVEATVVGLREEEDQLKESVAMLKVEQESLAHQKLRLSADVSSLETALRIRREELHAMEARAEGLERRILEGVIDHSRALLISKGKNNGRDAMSRKRVPSHAPSATGSVLSNGNSRTNSRASNTTQSAVSMAMNGNRAMVHVPVNNPAGASRRILSLNQITNNVPTGGFTRSHSVKAPSTTSSLRKSSWGGSMSRKYGELNKENLALKETEEDEEGSLDEEDEDDEDESDSGTMRRSSLGTTIYTTTGTGVSESIDEGTEWTGSDVGSSVLETPSEERDVVLYDEGAVQAA